MKCHKMMYNLTFKLLSKFGYILQNNAFLITFTSKSNPENIVPYTKNAHGQDMFIYLKYIQCE